ncbi:MAG: dihydroorotase [Methylococcaceae bacterium]
MNTIKLIRPDDWHVHLRDGLAMHSVVPFTARQFGRAIIMPNLKKPVTTVSEALAYRQRILSALPEGSRFTPLMSLYLTEQTTAEEIRRLAEEPSVIAIKLYPAGATTHSASGVSTLERVYPILEAMQTHDIPLLIHGEVTDPAVDIFDREKAFIDRHLTPMTRQFPELRMVLEHVTTADGVDFVRSAGSRVAATLTAHHLLCNRNQLLAGGIRPHYYCLPVLKREEHRLALVAAATSGDSSFFLGTDTAPHPQHLKESACGCAGCFTAHAALELYAEAFAAAHALDKLEGFASFHGADFYRLPRNTETVVLEKSSWQIPESLSFGEDLLIPFRAGEHLEWRWVA